MSSDNTDLTLTNNGRQKRNVKPITQLDPSQQTTSKSKKRLKVEATSAVQGGDLAANDAKEEDAEEEEEAMDIDEVSHWLIRHNILNHQL